MVFHTGFTVSPKFTEPNKEVDLTGGRENELTNPIEFDNRSSNDASK